MNLVMILLFPPYFSLVVLGAYAFSDSLSSKEVTLLNLMVRVIFEVVMVEAL